MTFITMENISKTFYGVKALNNVALTLNQGEVLCLAGQNGCGKSTLIKILSGVYQPDKNARITIDSDQYDKLTPKESIKKGIQVIYQDLSLFPNLTVAENIAINLHHDHFLSSKKNIYAIADNTLKNINANLTLDALVETLSVAQQQLVAICRALAQDARLIIMDEPTASLTVQEVQSLLKIVQQLKNTGISIIFVSHKLNEVIKVSDQVLVLKDGNLVGSYPISEINEKRLAYLMTGIEFHYERLLPVADSKPLLTVNKLSKENQYQDISFSLQKGEVISIIGLLGSGRTELCLSLFGVSSPDSGDIILNNRKVIFKSNRDAISAGIGYVSEDRMATGLVMNSSIKDNIISTIFNKITSKFGLINEKHVLSYSNHLIQQLKIKSSNSDLPVNTLSGGNAQRVSIAKWLAIKPDLLILDEPTIGVDIANKEGIFNIIKSLSIQGISVIFITDEVEEAYYNSHRIFVMKSGKISHEFIAKETSESEILEAINEK
ncbi:sugar ABC transporter ATP-binding protein [Testudinibacter sp. TR-2022]|uniref:sugar ABC transporter ATP-binding protein n=1 Tax=Testudinibacter sp. TR-2022 TaxID=2585029 RepID=UPI001118D7C1|nr:sugar ABC transporter ATP-binding protein [Pasteurellaceae bacterium Phil11]TNH21692.1 sugar ABC transporter ATP-binding protein [Testudinibacter sp. TR-2022]TNH28864.1 sugar ABC transporter ATP-binding protein [Testudinibacter sp. TR-2022]